MDQAHGFSFAERIIDDWNQLPRFLIESPDILTFKAKLGTFWNAYQACNHADSCSGGSKPGIVTQMNSK